MHPYLSRLGVQPEVQEFFAPYYSVDNIGNLVFAYRDGIEHFGFAFHRVPVSEHCWIAGNPNFHQVRHVFICGSAMEAIACLHYNYTSYKDLDNLLFIAIGAALNESHVRWINTHLKGKTYTIVFDNDLLGKLTALKLACGIRRLPVTAHVKDNTSTVSFRAKAYIFDADKFSLNAFEKLSGYRFHVRIPKPKGFISYFDQLKAGAF